VVAIRIIELALPPEVRPQFTHGQQHIVTSAPAWLKRRIAGSTKGPSHRFGMSA
jgi:hypothetical protein